ncbi:MAG: glycogen-binding domain-containing protein [Gemmatimonadaceae bacterium]
MTRRFALGTLALIAWLYPNESSAQQRASERGVGSGSGAERLHDVTFDVGGLALRRRDERWVGAVSVVPQWRMATPDGALFVGGALSGTPDGYETLYGTLGVEVAPQRENTRAWDVAGTATVLGMRETEAIAAASVRGRKHWIDGRQGAWLGVTLGARTQDQMRFGSLVAEASLWREVAPSTLLLFSASATRAGDFVYYEYADAPEAEVRAPHTARFGEVALGARHSGRALEFAVDGRYRVGPAMVLGGSGAFTVDAVWWLTQRYALVALAGRQLAEPALGTASNLYATLGLRIAARNVGTRHSAARVDPVPGRRQESLRGHLTATGSNAVRAPEVELDVTHDGALIALRLPATAQTAELAGDFSKWQPIPLTLQGGGLWRLKDALPPGVYRLIVRIDGGEWRAPINVPRYHDDFGGEVGVVTIR